MQIWALDGTRGGTLWAGTLPGGLFRSADRGESWQLVESLWNRPERAEWFGGGYDVPGIHSICAHPRDADELLLGIAAAASGSRATTARAGARRRDGMRAAYMPPELADNPNIQDPHRIVRCHGRPDVLWCQHHNGILRSTDDARELAARSRRAAVELRLRRRGPSARRRHAPGSCRRQADQQRVPVDGALAVNRTRDGGASFEVLRDGLPQTHCYDLVYRHGLAVDAGGEAAVASTTGNCGRATTPAIAGAIGATCRRSTRCGSASWPGGRRLEGELPGLADQVVAEAPVRLARSTKPARS